MVRPLLCKSGFRLLAEGLGAGHGEGGLGFGFGFVGLGAGEGEGVLAGEDGAVTLVVDARERAGIDFEGDRYMGPGGDADALEADEGADGTADLRRLEVGLDDLVAVELAGVGYVDGGGEGRLFNLRGLEGVGGELDWAVGEGGVVSPA